MATVHLASVYSDEAACGAEPGDNASHRLGDVTCAACKKKASGEEKKNESKKMTLGALRAIVSEELHRVLTEKKAKGQTWLDNEELQKYIDDEEGQDEDGEEHGFNPDLAVIRASDAEFMDNIFKDNEDIESAAWLPTNPRQTSLRNYFMAMGALNKQGRPARFK